MEERVAKCEGEKEVGEVEEEDEVVLPGFRFHPTDEELIGFYLRRKVDNKPISIEIIKPVDIYKYDPWDLPKVSTVGGEKECYFFCLRGRKYRNSIRPNRVTGSGFWKATGIDRPIHSSSGPAHVGCIGLKKSLVYYVGSAGKGTKTDWMMHEFRLPPSNPKNSNTATSPSLQEAEVWTICRIFKRNTLSKKSSVAKQAAEESSSKTSSFDSDTGDEYKYSGCTNGTMQQAESFIMTDQFEDMSAQMINGGQYATFYNNHHQHQQQQQGFANDLYKEGNWDELGRMMEYLMDTSVTRL